MPTIYFKVSDQYTITPGGRYIKDGDFSGEKFREEYLMKLYSSMVKFKANLVINLDDTYSYAASFLHEAFGILARKTQDDRLLDIEFISNDEPFLIDEIRSYILDELL